MALGLLSIKSRSVSLALLFSDADSSLPEFAVRLLAVSFGVAGLTFALVAVPAPWASFGAPLPRAFRAACCRLCIFSSSFRARASFSSVVVANRAASSAARASAADARSSSVNPMPVPLFAAHNFHRTSMRSAQL
eukprot:CAMPEP_0182926518 /NCGR_PEP_ID=MMETSP0105_2-20130417/12125_1 /TAXON_ID=81532 ORGANISM="Acanthoeca-like sp., Strain 10tr" /NCGR_SAMPLE_ID=MMETSP0105_2 /ASSEMBLY_ACC=CAM_ASM_000205 /LENGTH=134 /DNA_ID=CAMNT_0025064415 /DNA_START=212 /DNA_END=618 /DNA_ORIENTATION=-